MKKLLSTLILLLAGSSWTAAYSTEADSGLLFRTAEMQLEDAPTQDGDAGVKPILLVAPDDVPERGHFSNSNMARVELLVLESGGSVAPRRDDNPESEQAYIVLEGRVELEIDGSGSVAEVHDVIFVPGEAVRGFGAMDDTGARLLRVDWTHRAMGSTARHVQPVIVSELRRPLMSTGGVGYLSVAPNARQQGNALSIFGYGAGHVRARNSLLLYHLDITSGRTFSANTRLARMGLSEYQAGGGTRWHFHPDREQCFVIISGQGLVEIGANTVEVRKGDIVFAPRHVGHGYKTTGEEPLKFFEIEWGRN